ncbi:Protein kinase C and casein kinase substrate in neurons protein 1 [Anabarilius grahami]|uniref:Protein kinase C and casein kinase substrate in neurons protein 1 n=1 Tax=Anabarilius grahami TaxID=495550 RepID=A0A3N0Z213_ANAGA|nr:Protein kinase C and casein kinase substrate in neurons protein 1 [Anabarilius grahami]
MNPLSLMRPWTAFGSISICQNTHNELYLDGTVCPCDVAKALHITLCEGLAASTILTSCQYYVGNYKRAVKRIDDGHRLCNDLMNCLQERAKIEKSYSTQLTEWSKRWRQLIEKVTLLGSVPERTLFEQKAVPMPYGVCCSDDAEAEIIRQLSEMYGSVERAWLAMMTEADKVSELHQEVKNGLMNEDIEKVKNWQKDSYHRQIIGGFKETKEADEGFKKAQKPWAKKLKEMETAKKTYHMACKEEKLAAGREADASVAPDQQKKLHEKTEKCKQDVQKAKEKYEKSLDELSKCTPQYMECMDQVFDQCQQHEVKRLTFLKEVLLDIKRHLNLTENQNYGSVYREFERTILAANTQEDLKWFSNNHGPGMHMNWPQFEEYNPDATNAVAKREKKKPDGVAPATPNTEHAGQAGDRGSVSSYDKNQAYSTEWSDDEQPAGYSGNETNGGGNSFEDDTVSRGGMRVRALYDYEGQEQDELSFKAGDELTKIEEEDDQGWCRGRLDSGRTGLYPANYVEEI